MFTNTITPRFSFIEVGLKDALSSDSSFSVLKIDGKTSVSKAYKFKISIVSNEPIKIEDVVDTNALLTLSNENDISQQREIHGKIFKIKENSNMLNKYLYDITLVSPFYYLGLNKRFEIFQGKNVPEIISQIIQKYASILNINVETKIEKQNYPTREYCTQYNQSDLDFISMLCQEEKISFVLDSSSNDPFTMSLVQLNDTFIKFDGQLNCTFNKSKQFETSFEKEMFYDFENPSLKNAEQSGESIETSSLEDNTSTKQLRAKLENQVIRDRLEVHSGSKTKDLKRYTKLSALHKYSNSELIEGKSYSMFTNDSYGGTLYESENDRTIDAIITSTRMKGYFPNALDEFVEEDKKYMFEVSFKSIYMNTPYIPKINISKPKISGVQTAIVASGNSDTRKDANTIDIDELGRLKVIFHFDENYPISSYVRTSSIFSGNNWGASFTPRVDTEVIVSFINGDIDQPIIIGALYNGANKMPHDVPVNKTKSYIKTASMPQYNDQEGYNELLFEDKQNSELLSLRAQKDYTLHALNDSTTAVDNNKNTTIGNNETILVKNDNTTTIEGNETKTVQKDSTTTITGNNELQVTGNSAKSVEQNNSESINGEDTKIVKLNQLENILIGKSLMVGAAYQISVGGAKNETVGASSTEQVGILKHMIIGKRFELSVGKSKLILNKDGTIILSGTKISLNGSKELEVNSKKVDIN